MKHTVATCAHLFTAPNGCSLMPSLTLARSSMPRRGGRTSAVRSVSPGGRREVRRSAARGVSGARRRQREARAARGARHEAQMGREAWVQGARGARRGGRRVRHVGPTGRSIESSTVKSNINTDISSNRFITIIYYRVNLMKIVVRL